jgi:hypothetical protein
LPLLEQFQINRKQKPLWHFCDVAFSDRKPDSTRLREGGHFPENALAARRLRGLKRGESINRTCDISMHLHFDPDGE